MIPGQWGVLLESLWGDKCQPSNISSGSARLLETIGLRSMNTLIYLVHIPFKFESKFSGYTVSTDSLNNSD